MLTAAAGLLLAWAAAADTPSGPGKGLQGTWALQSLQIDGQAMPVDALKGGRPALGPRLVVAGERYTLYLAGKPVFLRCKLDPAHTPGWIDLTFFRGPAKGKVFRGIYKLEGDRFTICRATEPGKGRPAAFATGPKSGLILGVWKRVAP
jgi:uncharacterized protein (TIGR03067 family)